MKDTLFQYFYQYHLLFKSWCEEKIKELLPTIPEDAPKAGPYLPDNAITLEKLMDRWNCNFNELLNI